MEIQWNFVLKIKLCVQIHKYRNLIVMLKLSVSSLKLYYNCQFDY